MDSPARRRKPGPVRRLDHHAVDARLEASLLEYRDVSREAGMIPEEAVERMRSHLLAGESRPGREWTLPSGRILAAIGVAVVVVVLVGAATSLRSDSQPKSPSRPWPSPSPFRCRPE